MAMATRQNLPKPFLKWAGGKTQLIPQLAQLFPQNFTRYCEPFVGSGAVYWYVYSLQLQQKINLTQVRLTDNNPELINTYIVVRDSLSTLIELLETHKQNHSNYYYYYIRSLEPSKLSPLERAARFIYLNKTCFNGLYRVNRSGKFNVPMGSYKNPSIFEADNLRAVSQALQKVDIELSSFTSVLDWAQKDDFIYFDPPYAPVSPTSNFTSYTANNFGETEQKQLAKVFLQLHARGCKLMLSNSWVDFILNLYKDFHCIEVKASRAINSDPTKRGQISEVVVINYAP
ncbi:MAG: DNA adenine methylase [Pseudanabaenaceae cyanobacterium]